jgi:HlyD family secretion protein
MSPPRRHGARVVAGAPRLGRIAASGVLAVLAAACASEAPAPLQGYAEGEFVYVASPYAGTLETLAVARGQEVAAGATLFVLDHRVEQAAADAAAARIRTAEARLENLTEGRRVAELDVIRAQAESAATALRLSRTQLDQNKRLYADGFVSKGRLDEVQAAVDRDVARVAEAQAQLRVAQQSVGRKPELESARAEIEAARADLAQARVRVEQKTGVAGAAGLVQDTYFRVGESVPAGSPVVSLLPPQNVKVKFFVPEAMVATLRIDQPVSIACSGCGAPIVARITYVSPQAEYTPPVIYSRESKAKLVFMVEARPATTDAARLRPGQPVEVTPGRP